MKLHNYTFAALFGLVGSASLYAVIFMGATHQLFMAIPSLIMTLALIRENKSIKKWGGG
ncbi:MAG: hypothetical protein ACK5JD_10955 [Mangrovibacterium sp.]